MQILSRTFFESTNLIKLLILIILFTLIFGLEIYGYYHQQEAHPPCCDAVNYSHLAYDLKVGGLYNFQDYPEGPIGTLRTYGYPWFLTRIVQEINPNLKIKSLPRLKAKSTPRLILFQSIAYWFAVMTLLCCCLLYIRKSYSIAISILAGILINPIVNVGCDFKNGLKV